MLQRSELTWHLLEVYAVALSYSALIKIALLFNDRFNLVFSELGEAAFCMRLSFGLVFSDNSLTNSHVIP